MRSRAPVVVAAAALLLAGCPSGPGSSSDSGAPDSGEAPDSGVPDSGNANDAGLDAGADAGMDAGVDAGSSVDAGTDAGSVDSGIPACVAPVEGCDAGDYVDESDGGAVVTVIFGGDAGLTYVPRCLQIASGQSVQFVGTFGVHTLLQKCGPVSVIPFTVSGTSHTFTFTQPGEYGYICTEHYALGMVGALNVTP